MPRPTETGARVDIDGDVPPGSAAEKQGIPLGHSEWSLWPYSLVRSAGFPLAGVDVLADPAVAAAADLAPDPDDGSFQAAWSESTHRTGVAAAEIAASPAFRLALAWQNPRFLETAVEPLLRQATNGAPANRKRRARERAVAGYWQRYCTKNDSIGFFGPVTWAPVARSTMTTSVPGPRLVDRASVFFEAWPIEALLRTLVADLDLVNWLRPRRSPLVELSPGGIRTPTTPAEAGSPVLTDLLARADGATTAAQVAAGAARRFPDLAAESLLGQLGRLRDRRWLLWRPELPVSVRPEVDLRLLLREVADPDRRASALHLLDLLTAARDRVQIDWSEADAVRTALAELDATFTAITGRDPMRNAGLAYSGRTLTYLECRRDVSVDVGSDVVAAMTPLALVLDSVRWLTATIRDRLLPHIDAVFTRLEEQLDGAPTVADLWVGCMPLLGTRMPEIVSAAIGELQRRWRSILAYDSADADVSYSAAELADVVRDRFPAARSGWGEARWCCPDVMIHARDATSLRNGDFSLVLGEIHPATNSVDFGSMVPHHPDPAELRRCLDEAFPRPRLLVALPRESRPRLTVRSHPALAREDDHRLLLTPHIPVPTVGRVSLAADVPVRRRGTRMAAILPGGDEFDVLDVFAEALKSSVVTGFDLLGRDRHPRVTVDRLVLARRTWTFAPAALGFAAEADEAARFRGARAWARQQQLPRRVFVSSPLEPKPFFVDFCAPVLVALLSAAVRRAAAGPGADDRTIKVVEMLPDHGGTWLADAAGRTYTAEFRFVAVDQLGAP